MAELDFTVTIAEELNAKLSPSKTKLIEAISYGMTNKLIAESFGITLKAVEQGFAELNKSFGTRDELYNPRLRIVSSLIAEDLASFQCSTQCSEVPDLNDNLKQTLFLTVIGLSTQAIAKLLSLSAKTVEQRLSQLYDYFGIDTRSAENPRVILLVTALLKGNIDSSQIKRLHRETSVDRLKRILLQPEYFVQKLTRPVQIIG
jgi:DNA-binding CsgD family transcriptional regulator